MKRVPKNDTPVSPLRYPGAKRWMSGYISRSIGGNNLSPDLFIELFAGGASVSLALLSSRLVKRVGLVDRDPLVASFWHTVFFDTDWMIRQVLKSDVSVEKWEQIKRWIPRTTRQRAFKCLYLNRTSFSGILAESAGPIGGKAQASEHKIDCRFNRDGIAERIRRIAQYRDQIAFVWG